MDGYRARRAAELCVFATIVARSGIATGDERVDQRRLEPGLLPALAYDSDTGFGVGAIGSLVRFAPDRVPFRWRLLAQLYLTIDRAPDSGLEVPFHDDRLLLDLPGLLDDRLRLAIRVAFGRSTVAGYHGLGAGTVIDEALVAANPRYYQYRRTYPEIEPVARVALARWPGALLDLTLGARLVYNLVDPYPGSKLAEDAAAGAVAGADDHGLGVATVGLFLDTRDNESAPSSGALLEGTARSGAGLGERFGYGGGRVDSRLFVALAGPRLVLAARALADALAGDPPVYELAIGGATTIRGARAGRYHGLVKLVGNLELRARFLPFQVRRQRFELGALAFLDAGRVFASYRSDERDDGGGVALGVGAGLRAHWGEHFIVRADLGRSLDDGTTGLYIDVNHIF